MNPNNKIKSGTTLTARSVCDSNCIFHVSVIERKGSFVTIEAMGNTKRVKVMSDESGEFIYALGKYSMCPIFRA